MAADQPQPKADSIDRREAMHEWWSTLIEWLPRLLWQHTKPEQNWWLNRRQKVAYTAKGVVCLLLGRDEYRGHRVAYDPLTWQDPIEVAAANFHRFHHHEFGEGADWDVFQVAYGWRDWSFGIKSVGYP